jgi:hypothetical protein
MTRFGSQYSKYMLNISLMWLVLINDLFDGV